MNRIAGVLGRVLIETAGQYDYSARFILNQLFLSEWRVALKVIAENIGAKRDAENIGGADADDEQADAESRFPFVKETS